MSVVAGVAPREQHHQDRQHACGDGRGQRQPRRLRADKRHRGRTGDGVRGACHSRLSLRRSLFRRRMRGRRWCPPVWQAPSWVGPSSPQPSSRPSWPARLSWRPWPVRFFAAFLAGAFFAALAGGVCAGGRRWFGGRWGGIRTRCRPARSSGRRCRVRLFVGSILLVCHVAAPLRLARPPGSGSHHARWHMALTGDGQCGRQRQRHGHDCQLGARPRSRHHRGDAVRTRSGQPHRAVAPCQHDQHRCDRDLGRQHPAVPGCVQLGRRRERHRRAAPHPPPAASPRTAATAGRTAAARGPTVRGARR